MKPESEWFRPPALKSLCSYGDTQRFLYVAEPVREAGCYGVSYEVTASAWLAMSDDFLERLHGAALAELRRRIECGAAYAMPEGSHMDQFRWDPVITRHLNEDGVGTYTIMGSATP
jgi:hypothetical protein